MSRTLWLLLGAAVMWSVCAADKILVAFPMPAKSHMILGYGVVRNLLKAGHEVTLISTEPNTKPEKNLRIIDVSNVLKLDPNMLNIHLLLDKKVDMNDHSKMIHFCNFLSVQLLSSEPMQKLLGDPKEQFDAVVIEWMFGEMYSSIAAVFNAPLIWVSTIEPHWIITSLIDEPLNPAYNSDILISDAPPFTFCQRVYQLYIQLKTSYARRTILLPNERAAYEKWIAPLIRKRGREPPSYDLVKYNASLVLGNSHPSLGLATKTPQNYKAIGGYHIDENVVPLPEDLKKIMDNAKNGVIYFSMGSNLKSKDFPEVLKKGILEMLGTLKQTVLWKFEEILPNLPKNVHILQWAPQTSILSHPNCVLFISHGGLLSTTEAIHFGVPIVGIPGFADQFTNVARAVHKGFAQSVFLSYDMVDELKAAIVEVTEDPKYSQKVKELSFIYHHRPTKPGVELVHWIEHVIRTQGAPHLRSPALNMPFYEKLYLDLIALIIIVLSVIIVLLKRVISSICGRNADAKKKNN